MSSLRTVAVLDLKSGDVVEERNADWPEPFCAGDTYRYTVDAVEKVNAENVHVGIRTDGMAAAIAYKVGDTVTVVS